MSARREELDRDFGPVLMDIRPWTTLAAATSLCFVWAMSFANPVLRDATPGGFGWLTAMTLFLAARAIAAHTELRERGLVECGFGNVAIPYESISHVALSPKRRFETLPYGALRIIYGTSGRRRVLFEGASRDVQRRATTLILQRVSPRLARECLARLERGETLRLGPKLYATREGVALSNQVRPWNSIERIDIDFGKNDEYSGWKFRISREEGSPFVAWANCPDIYALIGVCQHHGGLRNDPPFWQTGDVKR